jgi:hypothetical protein
MGDFSLDTKAPADHHVVLNGQRYAVIGITRTIQRTAAEKQTEARKLREEAETANGNLPEVTEAAALLMIQVAAMRLRPVGDAEPADTVLTRLWEAEELEIDRHLDPLLTHLYSQETHPVPPA